MKRWKASIKEEDMIETIGETRTTNKKVRNLVALLKKKLIMNLKVMMKKLSMFL